jgi:hypothetical protein
MIDSFLRSVFSTQWHVIFIVAALLLGATEAGFAMGRRTVRLKDDLRKGQAGGVQGAILALMGLLLGFTFALSAARFEARRDFVLREATAIRTTHLRAAFLAPERQSKVESLLRNYVDARFAFVEAGMNRAAIAAARQRITQLQDELWEHAVAASKEAPSPLVPTFVAAVNELINLDAAELATLRANVPGVVWLLVLFVSGCGCYISGYVAGTTGVRSSLPNFVLPLLLAIVITLIADLHRPRGGLIEISQQPMIELRAQLEPRPQ